MVNIVTAYEDITALEGLAKELGQKFVQVVSVINTINDKKAQIAYGENEHLLYGKSYIVDKILGMECKISANSFFQTNTQQAEQLYEIVLEFAAIENKDIVWDLYSGTGTISLLLAKNAKFVHGFELIASSVSDAEKNSIEFGTENTEFHAGDLYLI